MASRCGYTSQYEGLQKIWTNYEKGYRYYCGHSLPDNMIKNQKLPETLLTPTTKDVRDELISEKEILEQKIMSKEEWDICLDYSFKLFKFGQELASKNGLILVDTKYEFGKNKDGTIMLVDEIHTPDSSRYWIQHNYEERHSKGEEPDNIDKEFIRKWVKNTYGDPYVEGLEITIPEEMIMEMSSRYLLLHELITGEELEII